MSTPTGTAIRRASMADTPAIAVFQTTCWREAYRGLVPQAYLDRVTAADREARWRQRLAGEREVAVAEGDGRLRGVVSWATGAEPGLPAVELKSLYVAADHRGTGLAARLVDFALGLEPAFLWVFEANARARRFYARLGFVDDGARAVDPDTGLDECQLVRRFGGSR